jgi:hypothetical protein
MVGAGEIVFASEYALRAIRLVEQCNPLPLCGEYIEWVSSRLTHTVFHLTNLFQN